MDFEREVGFIWDIDGVLVDSPHEQAWRETAALPEWGCTPVTSEFYLTRVASRPRLEGGKAILEEGGAYERLGLRTPEQKRRALERFCAQKNALIRDLVSRRQFRIFDEAVAFLLDAKSRGVKQAAASASKNASNMLRVTPVAPIAKALGRKWKRGDDHLCDLFDVDVCGLDTPGGKAEIFRTAARVIGERFGEGPAYFFVFEDAPSGIRAARQNGMFAVGVGRIAKAEALRMAGADIVVDDLASLPFDTLKGLFQNSLSNKAENRRWGW